MIFSSYKFLLFLLIVFLGYYMLNRFKKNNLSKSWLVLASFYFYAQGSMDFLPFFIFTVFFNYIIGTALTKQQTKWKRNLIFGMGLTENLLLLGYFKYSDFFIENINAIAKTEFGLFNLALPIGISFL